MLRIYLETDLQVGTEEYYAKAIEDGYYGFDNETGQAFRTESGQSEEELNLERELMAQADANIHPAWDN